VADIALSERVDFGLASILPHAGIGAEALGAVTLWPVAPGQWLAHADAAAPDWADTLGERLADVAVVVDQSSAYVLWHIAGADAQRLLQKGLPVDLANLAPGAVIVGAIAHIGVIVHCLAPDRFHLAVFRSFALSFRDWLQASIAAL
jgi:sarcosine oxidase subunit gamma